MRSAYDPNAPPNTRRKTASRTGSHMSRTFCASSSRKTRTANSRSALRVVECCRAVPSSIDAPATSSVSDAGIRTRRNSSRKQNLS
nr:MAG: hypothetical protein [Apis mellifera filamentous virus]